jgi:hypothetical protein
MVDFWPPFAVTTLNKVEERTPLCCLHEISLFCL